MAEVKFTPEQQKVIDTRDAGILVAAAAGSGKTAVLVERIIQRITETENPIDIDRLLIVTFTSAAAAEMRDRIGAAIEKKLNADPDNEHLQRQVMLIHNAKITTIDSFCMSVVKEYFHVIGLDPGFGIIDEADATLMKADAMSETMEKFFDEKAESFICLMDSYAKSSIEKITDVCEKLYSFSMSNPEPEEWLNGITERLNLDIYDACGNLKYNENELAELIEKQPFMQNAKTDIEGVLKSLSDMCLHNIEICSTGEGPEVYLPALESDKQIIDGLMKNAEEGYKVFHAAISNVSFARLSAKKCECTPEAKEYVQNQRKKIKEAIKGLESVYCSKSITDMAEEIKKLYIPLRALSDITIEYKHAYDRKKREKNLLDFADLEHFTLDILKDESVCEEIGSGFDEIMIDEYQDSNFVQEKLLTSLAGKSVSGNGRKNEHNMFMVGDVKQSIYSFRMARPDLFMGKYARFAESGDEIKIDLSRNFRSRCAVIESINDIFRVIMRECYGGIEYDEKAQLNFGAKYSEDTEDNNTELILVCKAEKDSDSQIPKEAESAGENLQTDFAGMDNSETDNDETDDILNEEERELIELEALEAAKRIKELVGGEKPFFVTDKASKELRKAGFGDIVILLRKMAGISDIYAEVLASEGIPVFAQTQSGYYKTYEVGKVLQFIRCLDNPRQDIPFASVLYSPIGGLTSEELALIKIYAGSETVEDRKYEVYLYDAARKTAEAEISSRMEHFEKMQAVREKLKSFFEMFDSIKRQSEYLQVHKTVELIYEKTGIYDYVYAMPAGERRRANLDMLLAKALQFEKSTYNSLHDFARFVDKLKKYEVDCGEAQLSAEGGDTVRIMTIHKSKGLEFPIVILGGMGKNFNFMDTKGNITFHSDIGIGAMFIDLENRTKSSTIVHECIKRQICKDVRTEELRILYVALTRAKEKLIMLGSIPKLENKAKKWSGAIGSRTEEGLSYLELSSANCYLDYVYPAVMNSDLERTVSKNISYRLVFDTELYDKQLKEAEHREELLEELDTRCDLSFAEGHEVYDELMQKGQIRYEYEENAGIPVKVSVSELKRIVQEEEEREDAVIPLYVRDEPDEADETDKKSEADIADEAKEVGKESFDEEFVATVPKFAGAEENIQGTDRGTLYHKIMEHMPYGKIHSEGDMKNFISELVSGGIIREDAAGIVSIKKLMTFMGSDIAGRMEKAAEKGLLFRERSFMYAVSAEELYRDMHVKGEEYVLVQGIVDAYFVEDGKIILLDYKTDRLDSFDDDAAKEAELKRRYTRQMELYENALNRVNGDLKVSERYIYSFNLGHEISI